MDHVIIATFNEAAKAEPLKRRLEEAQIPAVIHDESTMEHLWFVGRPLAGVKLKVRARDYEKAVALMHEWDASEGVLRHAVRCPECHSSRVEYPQYTRKFLLPNLIGVLAALGIVEKKFYCTDCHFTWPKEGQKPSRTRPHMAPYYFLEGVVQREEKPVAKAAGH